MRRKKILVADLLCGAGGSSTGAARALADLGLEMDLVCVNHWQVAIDTHTQNHPQARHYCQDISTVRPHLIVPEGYLDLLMASPTCTHHSAARGGKPTSDQQRSDPWHIITWLTELRVKRVLIENVPEFVGWGPVDPRTEKPIKERKGEYFKAWTDTMRRLGFELEWRILNAADYGDATTRRRFFLEARSDRKPLIWPQASHMKRQVGVLPMGGLQPWVAARKIIDWNLQGKSILNRKRPLSPKTLARIYAGAVKFKWPEPFLVILRNHMTAQSVDGPVPTVAAGGNHIYLAEPVIVSTRQHTGGPAPRSVEEPVPTLTASDSRVAVAEPILLSVQSSGVARGVDHEPFPTITTGGAGTDRRPGCARPALVEPFLLKQNFRRDTQGTDVPAPTIMGEARVGLVEPMVVTVAHGNSAHEKSPNDRRSQTVDDPLKGITASGGQYAVVEPFVLSRHAGGVARSIEQPTPTQVAKHSHVLIAPYYSSGSGETCKSPDEPLDTVTTKGRFGVVVPVTNSTGGPNARDIAEPLPTMTTAKGGEFAIVMPVTHDDTSQRARDACTEPLPGLSGAARGDLAFITAAFGERPTQAPRVHDIADPAPTICATGHVNLVEGTPTYDIRFRMLEPHELAAAMGFDTDEARYVFTGNKTQKIKQIGNAVPVNTACALVKAVMSDAAIIKRPKPKRQKAAA